MNLIKLFGILTSYLLIFCRQVMAQVGGMGYYPYVYSSLGNMFGRHGGYPSYGYNPHYPMYGSYPCYTSIYCGGDYGFGYGGYPYYYNKFNTAFTSSSTIYKYFGSNGGFFG